MLATVEAPMSDADDLREQATHLAATAARYSHHDPRHAALHARINEVLTLLECCND